MTNATGPETFTTIDANDGITIEKAGKRYEVYVSGRFFGAADALYPAMKLVEMARAGR